jgi:uncharacterized protein YheU (UPF0270 family)
MNPDSRPTEEPLEIPLERIPPETLTRMLEEFVTREWSELTDGEYTLEQKVEQVLEQLRDRRAMIVYDQATETWNIIPHDP